MAVSRCPATTRSTIACSRFAALAFAISASACGQGNTDVRSAAAAQELPAPHERVAAERLVDDAGAAGAPLPRQEPASQALPPSGAKVTLGQMLDHADRNSPVLAVARSTRSRAEAARVAASQLLPGNPELMLAAGPRYGLTGTGIDLDISLTQQIQIAGERGVRLDAAARLRELTDAEIEQMRWLVHCNVHAEFHRALVEQERTRLAGRVVKFQQEVLRVVERQIAAGEAAPLFLRLAQAEVAQSQQVFVAAEQGFLASRIRLGQLTGWPAATPPMPSGEVDVTRDPPSADRLLEVAKTRMPSLRAGAARIREAEARVVVADREAWPRPSIGAQYRREGNPTSEGPSNILMGIVSVPITSFDRNQGARARARADATVALAEQRAAVQLLQGQIAEARSEVVAATQRSRAYGTEILPRFEENLVLLRRSFELGEIDILALSTGRERFLRIQSDALGAQLDYFVALAALERVVGVDLWRDDHTEKSVP